ncbi:Hypothetical predicted protein [Xyrichtys novacula]|uniref:Uncharacterized protein n=1 Tax=Xyrichtys novacula TaxID=13765 RepID=A0AAV1ERQ9_XYRNO|nr:Hypothetical predicted protein [Xyrichtys novacula]
MGCRKENIDKRVKLWRLREEGKEEYFKYVFVYAQSPGVSQEAASIVKPNASNSPSSHSSAIHTIGTKRGRNKGMKQHCLGLCIIFCQVQFVLASSHFQEIWLEIHVQREW